MTRTKVTVSRSVDKYETELDRELLKGTFLSSYLIVYVSKFREIAKIWKNLSTLNAKSWGVKTFHIEHKFARQRITVRLKVWRDDARVFYHLYSMTTSRINSSYIYQINALWNHYKMVWIKKIKMSLTLINVIEC